MATPTWAFTFPTSFLGTLIFIKFHPRRTGLLASSCVISTLVQNMWKNLRTKHLLRPLLEYSSAAWDPYTKNVTNQIEKVQKRAARFVSNDFTSRSEGCVTEIIQSLEWTSLADRRKVRRISILQQARLDHLSLPIRNLLQPVQRRSRHLYSNAYATLSANKDCYKYSYFPCTIIDWNFLPEHLTQIELIPQFKEAVTNHLQTTKQQQD